MDLSRFYPACHQKGTDVQAPRSSRFFDFRSHIRVIIFLEMDGRLNYTFHGIQAPALVRRPEDRTTEEGMAFFVRFLPLWRPGAQVVQGGRNAAFSGFCDTE